MHPKVKDTKYMFFSPFVLVHVAVTCTEKSIGISKTNLSNKVSSSSP